MDGDIQQDKLFTQITLLHYISIFHQDTSSSLCWQPTDFYFPMLASSLKTLPLPWGIMLVWTPFISTIQRDLCCKFKNLRQKIPEIGTGVVFKPTAGKTRKTRMSSWGRCNYFHTDGNFFLISLPFGSHFFGRLRCQCSLGEEPGYGDTSMGWMLQLRAQKQLFTMVI